MQFVTEGKWEVTRIVGTNGNDTCVHLSVTRLTGLHDPVQPVLQVVYQHTEQPVAETCVQVGSNYMCVYTVSFLC